MRTWKQGRIGSLDLSPGATVFVLCLKYPVARFFAKWDGVVALDGPLGTFPLAKTLLPVVHTVGERALTREELGAWGGIDLKEMLHTVGEVREKLSTPGRCGVPPQGGVAE